MKLLILHLSDSHIASRDTPVLQRAVQIADAIKHVDYEIQLCVIAFTGDLAYSGAEEEYDLVEQFLATIRDRLKQSWREKVPLHFVVLPGNHDCDFRTQLSGRDALLQASEESDVPSTDTVSTCTEVQSAFMDFRDAFASDGLTATSHLLYDYRFSVGNESIALRCLNTAWRSRRHESLGSLFFPPGLLHTHPLPADVVVTLFHHPYPWLTETNRRAIQKRVESYSDIILTGHEHDFTQHVKRGGRGELNLYIEGSPLQPPDAADRSEFNVVLLDTERKRQRIQHFAWDGARFCNTAATAKWDEYQVNRLRNRERFELEVTFLSELQDPGIALSHPSGRSLTLDDIFVYPDIRKVDLFDTKSKELVRGESLIGLIDDHEVLLITGAEKSGKSSLAKRLFVDCHDTGYVPLLIPGEDLRVFDDDRTYSSLEAYYPRQYSAPPVEAYKQLDRERRLVIIDDFHKLALGRKAISRTLSQLKRFAGHVVLLTDDIAQSVGDVLGTSVDGGHSVPCYRIQHFGYSRRDELAEKWFALDPATADNDDLLARRLVAAKSMMVTAIGRSFVPSYPIFILSILQAQHHSEAVDINSSTYGYYYELLIKRALSKESDHEHLDVKLGYLAHLAYAVFTTGSAASFSERELLTVHGRYEERFMIPVSFSGILRQLLSGGVLQQRGDSYQFKYSYFYYYFVAVYLRDHVTEPEVQARITLLCNTVHEEHSANILMFLAHVCKSPFVVEQMLIRARAVLKDVEPATLAADERLVEGLNRALDEIVYEEKSTSSSRKGMLERLDTNAEQRLEREGQDAAIRQANEQLSKIGEAFRTVQILGQIIKNFPGTMEGPVKIDITTACCDLGLRALGYIFGILKSAGDDLLRSLVDTIRADEPTLSSEEVLKTARTSLHALTRIAAYGATARISQSVGSPHLTQVYERLRKSADTPARELVHASLDLDQLTEFPKSYIEHLGKEFQDNPLALHVLKSLVVNHFHLFHVKREIKQRVCDKLGIPYKTLQATESRVRLLEPGE